MDRNHFVSLIVNNEGTYTAGITRKITSTKTITEEFNYPTFEDGVVSDSKTYEVVGEELEWFNLKIEFESNISSFQIELKQRLEEIKKDKADKAAKAAKIAKTPNITNGIPAWGVNTVKSQFGKSKNKVVQSINTTTTPANFAGIAKENELPFDYGYIDNTEECCNSILPYGQFSFDEQVIKSLVLQLVTGSIIIPNESKLDIHKWIVGMPALFEKRFGKGDEGFRLFRAWADSYVEFLCWYTDDDELLALGYTDDDLAALCAYDIIKELEKYPSNIYIELYIKILNGYLL